MSAPQGRDDLVEVARRVGASSSDAELPQGPALADLRESAARACRFPELCNAEHHGDLPREGER